MKTGSVLFERFLDILKPIADEFSKFENKVLYGCSWNHGGGVCVRWLFEEYYNIQFDYLVDDSADVLSSEIYRRNLFDYLRLDKTGVIFASDVNDNFLEDIGFEKNKNLYNIPELYDLSNVGYFEYLEKLYNIDIIGRETKINVKDICMDYSLYAVSRGVGIPTLCQYLSRMFPNKKVLDVGCGKGGAIISFADFGYSNVDGIELLSELCDVAKSNMKKMSIDSEIMCIDAKDYSGYLDYDILYFYDPFRGETFNSVFSIIEEAVRKNKKQMVIVYANPYEHKRVVENGIFKLDKQIYGDWFTRMANIYISNSVNN